MTDTPIPADEKAWRLPSGSRIPQWLQKTRNMKLTAATELLVTTNAGGFDVRAVDPNYTGPLMNGKGNGRSATITGGGNGVDLNAPSRLADRTAQAERMARMEEADYFGELVKRAREAAAKASRKFPQPNYVALKIAEEAGEVIRGGVHYAEGRMEWSEVEGEIVQLLAMLIRFVTEGDQINGIIPPARALSQEGSDA